MSEHLKAARNWLLGMDETSYLKEKVAAQGQALWRLLRRLESLQSPQMPSETPSSLDIETEAETSDTYSTFWSKSYPANLGLIDWRPAARDISAWLSSLPILGNELGVEIGVTLTSKASTPPAGSASPSTVEPTREGNGVAGSYDMKPFLEADGYPLSPAAATEGGEGA